MRFRSIRSQRRSGLLSATTKANGSRPKANQKLKHSQVGVKLLATGGTCKWGAQVPIEPLQLTVGRPRVNAKARRNREESPDGSITPEIHTSSPEG